MNPIVDKDFNYIIGLIIPKEILSLNPVIAGGFPLAIYRSLQIYKDPSSRGILKRWVADCYSQNKVLRYEALKRPRLEEFGDIDFWLLNSQIENESVDGYIQRSISSNIRVVNDSKWSISFKFLATDESDLYKDVITTESELLYQAVKKTF